MTEAMNGTVIDVEGVRRSYGELEAVRGVSLQVRRGELFALLGTNRAGKTTAIDSTPTSSSMAAAASRRH